MNSLTRRRLLGLGAAAMGASWLSCSALAQTNAPQTNAPRANTSRQNILLITADDLGMQLGCYGDKTVPTPNIDALANQGTRFDRGYVTSASCSPSRASLLTGYYPHQNGQWGLAYKSSGYALKDGIPTLPQLLREAGYFNGIMGKLHIQPAEKFPWHWERSPDALVDGQPTPAALDTLDPQAVTAETRSFLQSAKARKQPFFLMANLFDPHRRFINQHKGFPVVPVRAADVKPLSFQNLDTPELREQIAGYYNGIARLDRGVGALLNELQASGLAENTLIVFIGDNGPPFARGKVTAYEAGTHVPFLVKRPGANAVKTTNELTSAVDLMPTFLQAANLPVPTALPGRSLSPMLAGARVEPRPYLFTEYTSHVNLHFYPRRTVTDGRYKLIVNLLPNRANPAPEGEGDGAYESALQLFAPGTPQRRGWDTFARPGAEEFYDLQSDPDEWNNLAGQSAIAEHQKRLRDVLQTWREETKDPFLDKAFLAAEETRHFAKLDQDPTPYKTFVEKQRSTALPKDSTLAR